jgi:hypothetical protein
LKSFIENVSAKFYWDFKIFFYKNYMDVAPTAMQAGVGGALAGDRAWGKGRGGLAHIQIYFAYFLT